ncbi:pantoate--beta-alanine ligase [Moraxella sp. Tifton1]|uniref:pantoate--beta-alanine ligase n=1 Tax=Moraxella oculi TaxID=2940516 RepID=UPI0020134ED5|nr:pantoate--beta-alanine ligase [Moraxella sp. Tifton1]MCL1623860.1 pantoate--beta-alanine ligase [Moraxella sp. Tifton1]
MKVFDTITQLQSALRPMRDKKIALVPTMGNLHDGHIELVNIAKKHADVVVVSIFVNPIQFGAGEDFENYPRTFDEDCLKLKNANADFVFSPSIQEMYPVYPPNIQVLSGGLTKILCGKTRPTHFDGVGLVVSKLFNIVRPDVAVFGKKDYQQLAIIRQLNDELNFNVEIIAAQIVRADDHLALSSRNGYLTKEQRAIAPIIHQTLQKIASKILTAKIADYPTIIQQHHAELTAHNLKVDYLELYNDKLQAVQDGDRKLVLLIAVFVGRARLLDNLEIELTC